METKMFNLDLFPFEDLPLELQLMVFSYCTPKDRRDNLSFVSKSWAEKLQSFTEDYQLHLYDCCVKKELEPFSVLIKSTRQYRFLKIGKDVDFLNCKIGSRLLGHLGKHVCVLEIKSPYEIKSLLDDSNPLLMFPKLNKLIVTKMSDLTGFDAFPESLEHIHVKELSMVEPTKEVEHLKKIKNLRFWTSELIKFKDEKDESSTTILSVDEKLKEILESVQSLDNIDLKLSTNLIGTPVVPIDDVIGITIKGKPKKFLTFSDLPNLKSIIQMDKPLTLIKSCFAFHEVNLFPKVEELQITWCFDLCIKCFTTFIDSFPNLKKLAFLYCSCETEQLNYICVKLPQLKHLEVDSSDNDDQLLFNEPSEFLLGNLRELHTLKMSESRIINIENWPFMPNLKKLNVACLLGTSRINLKVFSEKLPNIESFKTFWGQDHSLIEVLTQNWVNLRILNVRSCFVCEKYFASIILNCKKLRELKFYHNTDTEDFEYILFRELPYLRRFGSWYSRNIYDSRD
uniref:CSON001009 protein n=1 Tax=Culicoides sonorensis TaxID=179676 RepID=A0A336KXF8_CULSO